MKKLLLLLILILLSSCSEDYEIKKSKQPEQINGVTYYYSIVPNIFNKIDSCQIIGNFNNEYHVNFRAKVYNDTIFLLKRSAIRIESYSIYYFYQDKTTYLTNIY